MAEGAKDDRLSALEKIDPCEVVLAMAQAIYESIFGSAVGWDEIEPGRKVLFITQAQAAYDASPLPQLLTTKNSLRLVHSRKDDPPKAAS